MTTDEQAAYKRLERAREDEQYRRMQAEENLEQEQRNERRMKQEYRDALATEREERSELVEQLQTANSRWDRARKFLEEKGLTEEFNDWDLKVIADDDEE
jgi:Skp family chaperone for outer membrane proteins